MDDKEKLEEATREYNELIESDRIVEENDSLEDEELTVKEKKNTNIVAIIVCSCIVLSVIVILIILILINIKDNHEVVSSKSGKKTLTEHQYEHIVDDYGDSVLAAVNHYMINNKTVPTFSDIENDIYYPDYSVMCNQVIINYDGTVFLDDCLVEGYYNKFKHSYGSVLDKPKSDNKKIYIYKGSYTDGINYFANNSEMENSDQFELIENYSCDSKDCIGYHIYAINNHNVLIYDKEYFLYDVFTKEKYILSGLGKEEYYCFKLILNNNNDVVGLFAAKKMGDSFAYYLVDQNKFVTNAIYVNDSSTETMVSNGYFAGLVSFKDYYGLHIINQRSGEVFKKYEGISYIKEEVIGSNTYYYMNLSNEDGRRGFYTDLSFSKIIKNMEKYPFNINSNGTITLIIDNKYSVYDTSGNILYESNSFDEIIMPIADYIIAMKNKNIGLYNLDGELVHTFCRIDDKLEVMKYVSGWNNYREVNGIFLVFDDTSIDDSKEGSRVAYYYSPEDGTSGSIKVSIISELIG